MTAKHPSERFDFAQGFNPCFAGSIEMTLFVCCFRLPYVRFNPCFAGSIEMTSRQRGSRLLAFKFQSLFCWIYRDDKEGSSCDLCRFFRFNPCFAGSIEMTHPIQSATDHRSPSFNPCFAGSIEMTPK